jgi:vacuolar protein-sorting-associated protein 4
VCWCWALPTCRGSLIQVQLTSYLPIAVWAAVVVERYRGALSISVDLLEAIFAFTSPTLCLLSSAMRRRFEKRVYIALPEAGARTAMFKLNLGDTPHNLSDADFHQLGEMSEGYSGSDVAVVVREALMEPLRKCQTAKQFLVDPYDGTYTPCRTYPNCLNCPMALHVPLAGVACAPPGMSTQCASCGALRMSLYDVPGEKLKVPVIEPEDFMKALKRAHSSVGVDELQRFVSWTEEFGQDG